METLLQSRRVWTDYDQETLEALCAQVRALNARGEPVPPRLSDRIDKVRERGVGK